MPSGVNVVQPGIDRTHETPLEGERGFVFHPAGAIMALTGRLVVRHLHSRGSHLD
jgi:hypothetical protein